MDLIIPTFFSLIIIFMFMFFRRSATSRSRKLPPGPWKLPLVGSIFHLAGPLPHRALKGLAAKHGPLMHLQLGEISAVVVSSPRLAKEVLRTHDLSLANRPKLLAAEINSYNYTDIAFAPYGDYWRQMRKIATLELLSAKKVHSFHSIREEEVWNLVEYIHSSSSSTGSSFNLTKMIFSLTNSIVCRSTFGERCKEQDSLIEYINEVVTSAGGFDVADLFPSFKLLHFVTGMRAKLEKVHHNSDQILDNIISKHIHKGRNRGGDTADDEEDIVDVLIRVKESGTLDFPITYDNIKSIIWEIFGAGTDTSSVTVVWAMAELMRNPRVMEKAQADLRQGLKGKQVIHESDIKELGGGYLNLVIKETLRLHPPAPLLVPRECREECEVDGYSIPVGTKVIVNAWALGRDPEYWKDAESFYPERFENSSVDVLGNNYEYIPFGSGRRMCPGIKFGLANVVLPLAQLLYHFNWKLPNGMKAGELDMSESFGAVVSKKTDLHLIATCQTPLVHSL